MPITESMKNEYVKRMLRVTGVRPPQEMPRRDTPHYRMPRLEANGGWLALGKYNGPETPQRRSTRKPHLHHVPHRSEPPISPPSPRPSGDIEILGAFGKFGKSDLDREWTPNAQKCPTLIKWLESVGARFGKVQLLRMSPNTLRECRWGLHLDHNNQNNPETNGWAVRVWHEMIGRRIEPPGGPPGGSSTRPPRSRSRSPSTRRSSSIRSGSTTAATTTGRTPATR